LNLIEYTGHAHIDHLVNALFPEGRKPLLVSFGRIDPGFINREELARTLIVSFEHPHLSEAEVTTMLDNFSFVADRLSFAAYHSVNEAFSMPAKKGRAKFVVKARGAPPQIHFCTKPETFRTIGTLLFALKQVIDGPVNENKARKDQLSAAYMHQAKAHYEANKGD